MAIEGSQQRITGVSRGGSMCIAINVPSFRISVKAGV